MLLWMAVAAILVVLWGSRVSILVKIPILIVPPRLAFCADASGTLLNGSACDTATEAADQPSAFRNDRRPSSTRSALLTTSNPSRLVPILVPSLQGSYIWHATACFSSSIVSAGSVVRQRSIR